MKDVGDHYNAVWHNETTCMTMFEPWRDIQSDIS